MKIDLSNPVVRFLVGNADFTNGCSVVRGIMLRSLLALGGAAIASIVAAIALMIIAGTVLYIFSPWYGQLDVDLSLSWLGPAWWADGLRVGAVMGLILGFIGSVWLALKLMFMSIERYGASTLKFIPSRERIANNTIVKAACVAGSAVSAFAHKFCPNIEVVIPASVQEVINNYEKTVVRLWCTDYNVPMKITEVVHKKYGIRLDMEAVDNPTHKDYIFFSYSDNSWNESVEFEQNP